MIILLPYVSVQRKFDSILCFRDTFIRGYMCLYIFCGKHLLFEVLAYYITLADEVREHVEEKLEYFFNAFTTGKAVEIVGNAKGTMVFHRVSSPSQQR